MIDLLKAYADIHRRNQQYTLKFSSSKLFTIKDGQNIISNKIASNSDWFSLKSLLPDNLQSEIMSKSFYSSTFNASLHMAKKDKEEVKQIDIKQSKPFSDIYLRNMSETSQKIEALIFASSKPVSENEIKKRLDIHEDISEVMSNLELLIIIEVLI